jgi:carbamoyl-phosphate synthase large subunit
MALSNVLITAASRRVPLVAAFQRALRSVHGKVIAADVNPLSPAVYAADRAFRVPNSNHPHYLDEILAIAKSEDVGLIVPTIDDELTVFARSVDRFTAEGIRVVISPEETTELCHDKYQTCRTLSANGIAAARSFLPWELPDLANPPAFPLFIKPRRGRGGVGAFVIRDARELAFFVDYVDDPVVQEYLDGPEFTIDMLCDFSGRPLSIVPRERVVIRAGVIDRGRTVKSAALIGLGLACADALTCIGPVNIQCRVVGGRPIVFEINPRFSGGIPLTIESGADFPAMLVQLAAGRTVAPAIGQFRDDVWMTSYESSFFLDGARIGLDSLRRRTAMGEVA